MQQLAYPAQEEQLVGVLALFMSYKNPMQLEHSALLNITLLILKQSTEG